jgi:hypothetical protein
MCKLDEGILIVTKCFRSSESIGQPNARSGSELAFWRRLPLVMLSFGWLVLGLGLAAETLRPNPEPTIRAYLADLEARRVEQALAALTPEAATRWGEFVELQQFNRYRVVSVAVRSPSVLESLTRGQPWLATQATLIADVSEPSGITWRASTIVPLEYAGGTWRLRAPPFASQ